MTEPRTADLSKLPDWARKAFEATLRPPPTLAQQALERRQSGVWPLLAHAAVLPQFEQGQFARVLSVSSAEERSLLHFAEAQRGVGGFAWTLQRDVRSAVLDKCAESGELPAILEQSIARFHDPVTMQLRDCVQGMARIAPDTDLRTLEALRVAVNLLSTTPTLATKAPTLEAIDREIVLRRLLAQFERMTDFDRNRSTTKKDRVFGRDGDVSDLRVYVDALESEGFLEGIGRVVQRAKRVVTHVKPLNVYGVGGVGKTTLMAQFMLQHAHGSKDKFPFAYLDFDRTTVSARDPIALLIDIVLQVGAQFPELGIRTLTLRNALRAEARRAQESEDDRPIALVRPYLADFARLVDAYFGGIEGRFARATPFLLVFDTFELVQYSVSDLELLEEFVRCFDPSSRLWSRLRLVISGRQRIESFLGPVEHHPVEALDLTGSVEMIQTLASDADKKLSARSAERLITTVLTALGGDRKKGGLHPLRLRLLSYVIRDAKDDDAEKTVDWIVKELESDDVSRSEAGRILVDGILIRRILDHVRDYRVRALADPGLVVRRITPDVIQAIMAKGTTKPEDKPAPRSSLPADDSLDFDPWILSAAEANEVFQRFASELTLVENHGKWLRHRPDVRQEMFGLVRLRRPNRFRKLHELAFAHYREAAAHRRVSDADRAELIYHALWLGVPLETIDTYWTRSFNPRIDPDDFDEKFPVIRAYLSAKSGARLTPAQITLLPRSISLAWFERRRSALLEDSDDSYVVRSTRAVMGDDFALLDDRSDVAADVVRLLIRTGEWGEALKLALRHVPEVADYEAWSETGIGLADPASRNSLVRSIIAVASKSRADVSDLALLIDAARAIRDETGRMEAFAYLYLALERDSARVIADMPPVGRRTGYVRTTRLVSLTRPPNLGQWISAYCASPQPLPRDLACAGAIFRVFKAVYGQTATFRAFKTLPALVKDRRKYQECLEEVERLWRQDPNEMVRSLRSNADLQEPMLEILRFDHGDWFRQLAYSFDRVSADDHQAIRNALEKLLKPWSVKDIWDSGIPTGHGIMQYLSARVGYTEIATAIRSVRPRSVPSPKPVDSAPVLTEDGREFPSSIYDLCDALGEWHECLGWSPAASRPRSRRIDASPPRPRKKK